MVTMADAKPSCTVAKAKKVLPYGRGSRPEREQPTQDPIVSLKPWNNLILVLPARVFVPEARERPISTPREKAARRKSPDAKKKLAPKQRRRRRGASHLRK